MSATPSAGALRAACSLYGRTDSLYMSERQCALVIHDAIQAETAALVAALEFYADVSKYPAPKTGGLGELYFDCGGVAKKALAKHGKGAL